jgi:hypothetical protein
MDNIYLADAIRSFQSAYISALNDAYSHIVIPTTSMNNIVVTTVLDVQTRMIPINVDKTIYFASCGFIVVIDKYLRRTVIQIEPDDCDVDRTEGLVLNNNIYRKLPGLEYILPRKTNIVDLTNMCFIDISDIVYKSDGTVILSTGENLTEYVTDILVDQMYTTSGGDTWSQDYIYDSTYDEYIDYFNWFDPRNMYKRVGEYNGYGWC